MSSDWNSVSLGECVEFDTGFPFKSAQYTESEAGVRLLRGDNIGQGSLRWEGAKRWIRKANDSLEVYELRQNDLVLAMDRPWIAAGLKFAKVRDNDLPALLVQRVARLRPKPHMDVDYLHSVISSPDFTLHIQNVTTGTAVPHISGRQIQDYKFALPDLGTQRSVGKFLMSLDDRITLLRETNDTLEAIAQALFKSWFVDFDPVRAKMAGQVPEGMDEATAALFPDSFEESELGLVPSGWRVGTVADVGDVVCGKTPPTSDSENYGYEIPFITIPDMHGVLLVTSTARSLSRIGADSQKKKYLPPGTVCVSCIATPGLVVRVTTESQTNQQINSVIPLPLWGKAFPLFLLRRIGDAVRSSGSGGSVFHNLSKSGFEKLALLLTNERLAQKFDEIVEPLLARIEANQKQSQTFSIVRDTLLPRLISGQLRLPAD